PLQPYPDAAKEKFAASFAWVLSAESLRSLRLGGEFGFNALVFHRSTVTNEMLFRLEKVFKSYGAHDVLRGATVQVNPDDRVGLVGRNGAGKTTIFRLITGKEEADRGDVILLRGLKVGVLDQQPAFTEVRTVRDEALSVFSELQEMEHEISRIEHSMGDIPPENFEPVMHAYSDLRHRYEMDGGFTYHSRAEAVLAGLGFISEDFSMQSDQLSGGQKARLALAKLLLREPDLL